MAGGKAGQSALHIPAHHSVIADHDLVAAAHRWRWVGTASPYRLIHPVRTQARQHDVARVPTTADDHIASPGRGNRVGGAGFGQNGLAGGGVGCELEVTVIAKDQVSACSAHDQVGTKAAQHNVLAVAGLDRVIAAEALLTGLEAAVAAGSCPVDLAVIADHQIIAATGGDLVGSEAGKDQVVACARRDRVVAAGRGNGVGRPGLEQQGGARRVGHLTVVTEDHVGAQAGRDDISTEAADDDVGPIADVDQVVATQRRLRRGKACQASADVPGHDAVVADDDIVTEAGGDRVVAAVTDHKVITTHGIESGIGVEEVVPFAAVDLVVALGAVHSYKDGRSEPINDVIAALGVDREPRRRIDHEASDEDRVIADAGIQFGEITFVQRAQHDAVSAGAGEDLQAVGERTPLSAVEDVTAGHAAELHIAVRTIGLYDRIPARITVIVDQQAVVSSLAIYIHITQVAVHRPYIGRQGIDGSILVGQREGVVTAPCQHGDLACRLLQAVIDADPVSTATEFDGQVLDVVVTDMDASGRQTFDAGNERIAPVGAGADDRAAAGCLFDPGIDRIRCAQRDHAGNCGCCVGWCVNVELVCQVERNARQALARCIDHGVRREHASRVANRPDRTLLDVASTAQELDRLGSRHQALLS